MRAFDPNGLDALDQLLDSAALRASGRRTKTDGAASNLDPATSEAIRRMFAADTTPPADAAFLARLRKDLMYGASHAPNRAASGYDRRSVVGLVAHPPSPPIHRRATVLPGSGGGAWRLFRAWFGRGVQFGEASAVCLLLVALVGLTNGSVPPWFSSPLAEDDPVVMLHGNAGRTGEMPGPGPVGEPGLLWRWGIAGGDQSASQPVIADGVVYYVERSVDPETGRIALPLVALDLASGSLLWRTSSDELNDEGAPAVANGLVFASGYDGFLHAFDTGSGEEVWRYRTGQNGYQGLAVAEGIVYLSRHGVLHAVDAVSGEGRWTFSDREDDASSVLSTPALTEGMVFVTTHHGLLLAVDAESGLEQWRFDFGGDQLRYPVVADGTVYVTATYGLDRYGATYRYDRRREPLVEDAATARRAFDGSRLFAITAENGVERWSIDFDRGLLSEPSVVDGTIYQTGLGTDGNEVQSFDAATGGHRWTFPATASLFGAATVADDIVYLSGAGSGIVALDAATGEERWSVQTGGIVSAPVFVADGAAVFGSTDGHVYAVGGLESDAGLPVAMPVPDGDLSNLPSCSVEPRPIVALEGTPAASVVHTNKTEAARPWSVLPTGKPVGPQVVAEIDMALDGMRACARPGDEERLASFYSDDYFRRRQTDELPAEHYRWLWAPDPRGSWSGDFDEVFVLSDGRIAVLFIHPGQSSGTPVANPDELGVLVVFVRQDGRLVVDEIGGGYVRVAEGP